MIKLIKNARQRVTDRAVDLDASGLEGPPHSTVAQHGDVVGRGAGDQIRTDDAHITIGVEQIAVDGVSVHSVDH